MFKNIRGQAASKQAPLKDTHKKVVANSSSSSSSSSSYSPPQNIRLLLLLLFATEAKQKETRAHRAQVKE